MDARSRRNSTSHQYLGLSRSTAVPLANARVAFNPRASGDSSRAGPDSYAKTDENGRFELETIDGFAGAVVATHRVRIRTRNEEERDGNVVVTQKEILPDRYHAATELEFIVPQGGTDVANFELTFRRWVSVD